MGGKKKTYIINTITTYLHIKLKKNIFPPQTNTAKHPIYGRKGQKNSTTRRAATIYQR